MDKLKKDGYDREFFTPLNVQKPAKQVGPEVANLPPQDIPDPLSTVPGGARGGSMSGGASKALPKDGK
jgi:hypothetical protein